MKADCGIFAAIRRYSTDLTEIICTIRRIDMTRIAAILPHHPS